MGDTKSVEVCSMRLGIDGDTCISGIFWASASSILQFPYKNLVNG